MVASSSTGSGKENFSKLVTDFPMKIQECSATQGLATDESVMIESRPANCALKA